MPPVTAKLAPAPSRAALAQERPPRGYRVRAGAEREPWAFASTHAATRAELLAAPVRWPRPARLEEPLKGPAGKLADGLRTLGVERVGALLEHLPRDRREARSIAQLRPGEQATVAVEVESIAARPVRRRGMRPLVEATVFDETGAMGAAFFNQPWLVDRYRPGTRLLLHGKATRGGRFAVVHHALGGELAGAHAAGEIAHYPATVGVSSTQIAALVREHRGALADVADPLPARMRAAERLPDRAAALGRGALPARRRGGGGGAHAAGVRGAAVDAAGAAAPPRAARVGHRDGAGGTPRADRALAAESCRSRRPPTRRRRSRRSTPTSRARARCSAC